jgi:hypothetical protein
VRWLAIADLPSLASLLPEPQAHATDLPDSPLQQALLSSYSSFSLSKYYLLG